MPSKKATPEELENWKKQRQINWDIFAIAGMRKRIKNLSKKYGMPKTTLDDQLQLLEDLIRQHRPPVTKPAMKPNKPFKVKTRERYFT